MKPLLRIEALHVAYAQVAALKGISLELMAGEITALVGANGAGKSTTLLAISGLIAAQAGRIVFEEDDLRALAPHRIVARGVVQVAEGRAILGTLTVSENLALGAYTRKDKVAIRADLDWVLSLFPVLKSRATGLAGNLSGGEQQMLAIARALMARPKVLLLDEPSMGLAPLMVQEIFRVIVEINRAGLTVLLVEQNVRQALKISSQAYVLENGAIVLHDSGANLLNNPQVIAAYLGG